MPRDVGTVSRSRPRGATFALEGDRLVTLTDEGPSPRHSTPLAWDAERELVVLYGGKSYAGDAFIPHDGLWGFDGATWQRLDGQRAAGDRRAM